MAGNKNSFKVYLSSLLLNAIENRNKNGGEKYLTCHFFKRRLNVSCKLCFSDFVLRKFCPANLSLFALSHALSGIIFLFFIIADVERLLCIVMIRAKRFLQVMVWIK